ncbi:hypothetical protein BGW42_000222 [Actinomortierella wolfii]|nr:hypothetical protein BGW42_000222 [Actinomortierella wolfii]
MTSMLTVYSPLQHEPTSSYPFYTEMRPSPSTSSHREFYDSQNSSVARDDQGAHTTREPGESGYPQQPTDIKSAPNSSSSTASASSTSTAATEVSQTDSSLAPLKGPATDEAAQPFAPVQPRSDNMVPSQSSQQSTQETTHAEPSSNVQAPMYMSPSLYTSHDYSELKALPSQPSSQHYLSSPNAYSAANVAAFSRQPMPDRRTSAPLPAHTQQSPSQPHQSPLINSTAEVTAALSSLDVGQRQNVAWVDPTAAPGAQPRTTATVPEAAPQQPPLLPPLSDTLHRIFPGQTTAAAPAQPVTTIVTMDQTASLTTATPYYPSPVPFVDVPGQATAAAAGVVYQTQDPYLSDPSKLPPPPLSHDGTQVRHPSPAQMMPANTNVNVAAGAYPRRVTYPFVPSIDTSSGLVVGNLISPASSASSPLINSNPFTHGGGLVGVNATPLPGVVRPTTGLYMDASMAIPHQGPVSTPHLGQPQPLPSQPIVGQQVWPSQESAELPKPGETSTGGSKGYPFVSLSGVTTTKKRPRRRFDEIERLYVCNWGDCEKSYGTLNHLNAHVTMQKHGPKRHPSEFKELRKAWRRHKKAEEEAAKQAAAAALQQQQQQLQLQQQLCEPTVAGFHPHPMQPMHAQFAHQQPPQLPMPHPHPNQYQPHPHPQSQHHPLGY